MWYWKGGQLYENKSPSPSKLKNKPNVADELTKSNEERQNTDY